MADNDGDTNKPTGSDRGQTHRHYPSRRGARRMRQIPESPAESGVWQLQHAQQAGAPIVEDYWEADANPEAVELSPVKVRKVVGSRKKQRARRRRRRLIALATVLAVSLALGVGVVVSIKALGGVSTIFSSGEDYEGEGSGSVYVDIPKGATGKKIGEILEKQGVVKSAEAFAAVFKKNSLAQGVQAGRFEMRKHMSAKAALSRLLDPQARADRTVTIPEGFTLKQIKDRLVKANGFPEEDVDKAFSDPAAFGIPAASDQAFEGWLAPSSYTIDKDTKLVELVKQMVDLQKQRLAQASVPQDKWSEILLKASIIEREVNQEEYYAKVARVIENRIIPNSETRGFLQMDSTVRYGLGKSGGIPTREELKQDTPYNTYLHKGLPPTPIGTPGEKAINAALHPEPGTWLYFVTVNLDTGETKFASSLTEQNANVEELKKWCKDNPGKCSN